MKKGFFALNMALLLGSLPIVRVGAQITKQLEMVEIPAGVFLMGEASLPDSGPVHSVKISHAFLLSKFDITNQLFCEVARYLIDAGQWVANKQAVKNVKTRQVRLLLMDADQYHQFGVEYHAPYILPVRGHEMHPVVGITWQGALEFCNALSRIGGLTPVYDVGTETWNSSATGYRLPTEAEWEYAARGGGKRSIYPWGDTIDSSVANYWGSKNPFSAPWPKPWSNGGPTTPVGFYDGTTHGTFETRSNASPFGVFDMGGNVANWCWDSYSSGYQPGTQTTDPTGPIGRSIRKVVRGGSWEDLLDDLRVYNRQSYSSYSWANEIGIRVARTLE